MRAASPSPRDATARLSERRVAERHIRALFDAALKGVERLRGRGGIVHVELHVAPDGRLTRASRIVVPEFPLDE